MKNSDCPIFSLLKKWDIHPIFSHSKKLDIYPIDIIDIYHKHHAIVNPDTNSNKMETNLKTVQLDDPERLLAPSVLLQSHTDNKKFLYSGQRIN